jgi:protein-disulfide reductase (glutathione)
LGSLNAPLVRLLAAGSFLGLMACGEQKAPPPQQRVDASAQPKAPVEVQADPAGAGEANGFGKAVAWRKFDVAMDEAKASGKPIMMVVHTSWCGRCKALKPSFKQPEIASLSKEFVMVNVDQDRVPAAAAYAPDGEYIPRVMFFSPEGELDAELTNGRGGKYSYFYTPMDDLSLSMKTALERHGRKG